MKLFKKLRVITILKIIDIKKGNFSYARYIMKKYHLLSNDALHVAIMHQEGIQNIATNDSDFEKIKDIRVLEIY